MKPQTIRLLDVFAIGPAMVFIGAKAKNVHPAIRGFVAFSGVATIIYNGQNYLEQKRRSQQQ